MERTGLGYETLRAINARLIMVAMSGAGQFGPLADMRTYAPAMSSFAGLETLVGYKGESPVGALNFALGDPNAAATPWSPCSPPWPGARSTGRGLLHRPVADRGADHHPRALSAAAQAEGGSARAAGQRPPDHGPARHLPRRRAPTHG